jgi:hypothetical protein
MIVSSSRKQEAAEGRKSDRNIGISQPSIQDIDGNISYSTKLQFTKETTRIVSPIRKINCRRD